MTKPQAPADPAIESLVHGTHADPFSVLGPHLLTPGAESAHGLAIRAIHPAAERVEVVRLDTGAVTRMTRRHPHGFFEAMFPDSAVFDYRLRVSYHGGDTFDIDDPYRYGRVLSDFDLHLFNEGSLLRAYDHFGAQVIDVGPARGVHFAVWAPNAERVSVVGDFNGWDGRVHPMRSLGASGVWEIFLPGLGEGECYKFEIRSRVTGAILQKADPYAFFFEVPPRSASIVRRLDRHEW